MPRRLLEDVGDQDLAANMTQNTAPIQDGTPLHWAVAGARVNSVNCLLAHGADAHAQTLEVTSLCLHNS